MVPPLWSHFSLLKNPIWFSLILFSHAFQGCWMRKRVLKRWGKLYYILLPASSGQQSWSFHWLLWLTAGALLTWFFCVVWFFWVCVQQHSGPSITLLERNSGILFKSCHWLTPPVSVSLPLIWLLGTIAPASPSGPSHGVMLSSMCSKGHRKLQGRRHPLWAHYSLIPSHCCMSCSSTFSLSEISSQVANIKVGLRIARLGSYPVDG